MQVISTFSGVGGFELAAEWIGWQVVASCEIRDFCRKVLAYYWPDAYHHDDIKTLTVDVLKEKSGWNPAKPTILVGGFPCQPYSSAGLRLGKEDERHLWPEMLRLIREVSPEWVVGENVRGLTTWNGGMVFDEVQTDLENAGYDVLAFLLPAVGVDAPHRRDRVWFVAHSRSHQRDRGGADSQGNYPFEKWFMATDFENNRPAFRCESKGCSSSDTKEHAFTDTSGGGCNGRGCQQYGCTGERPLCSNLENQRIEIRSETTTCRTPASDTDSDECTPGIEVNQQSRQTTIADGGINASNTDRDGFGGHNEPNETGSTQVESESIGQERERIRPVSGRISPEENASNPSSPGLQKPGQTRFGELSTESSQGVDHRSEFLGDVGNPDCQQSGSDGPICQGTDTHTRGGSRPYFGQPRNWNRFPTESPVCSGNDGISTRLVGITVSQHRTESIKSYGNAVVPAVVLQIFKAIQKFIDTYEIQH